MPDKESVNQPAVGGAGGEGTLLESLQPGEHHRRESLLLLHRAVKGRWNIPDHWYDDLPKVAALIAVDKESKPRERIAAVKLLHDMARDSLDAALALERLRVDGSMADQLISLTFEIVEAKKPTRKIASKQRKTRGNGEKDDNGDDPD